MKRSLIAIAALMSVAGVAAAQTSSSQVVPPPEKNGSKPKPAYQEGGTPIPNSKGVTGSVTQPQNGSSSTAPIDPPKNEGTGKSGGGSSGNK